MINKIVELAELIKIVEECTANGKIVAATSGCFDILHAGHVTYLEKARNECDMLIVFLNSDRSVRSLKGVTRPIVPQNERAIVIAGLESVNYVCVFDELDPCTCLSMVKPHYFIKGADYKGKTIPEMKVLYKYGGEVRYISMVDGCSSTNIVNKIRNLDCNG